MHTLYENRLYTMPQEIEHALHKSIRSHSGQRLTLFLKRMKVKYTCLPMCSAVIASRIYRGGQFWRVTLSVTVLI
jgi:hypothetical protein